MLSVEHLTRRFGGVVALDDVSFDVPDGQILGLIGPNGAGKTTAFNVITRLYKPDSGQVVYDGENLLKVAPYDIVRRGIARTFQNVELFSRMSVLENVLVGAHSTTDWFREEDGRARALEALELTGIADLAPRIAASPPVRDAEADRARARARLEAASAAARRAGGRPQPRGGARVRRLSAPHQEASSV